MDGQNMAEEGMWQPTFAHPSDCWELFLIHLHPNVAQGILESGGQIARSSCASLIPLDGDEQIPQSGREASPGYRCQTPWCRGNPSDGPSRC